MNDKQILLQQYFGHDSFRPGQESLIDGILSGRDALGIMPTGGGKSLCYQIPALMLPGITLVISPLISLMKDQVAALKEMGVSAAFLNSSLSPSQMQLAMRRAAAGHYKIIYVAPERLLTPGFSALIQAQSISLIAVDEAHCISQWGQDFRPSYMQIPDFINALAIRPVVAALTATATSQVRQDIERLLQLRNPFRVITGFDRPNLFFDVSMPKDKTAALLAYVRQNPHKSGIVYCATRAKVEAVCEALQAIHIPATRYHAGLSDDERRLNQEDFQFDRKPVMVATNAFGMGIDKSNVSYVIHYNMPKSLEAYYQEAGRAGRDGEPADCLLYYAAADVHTARFLIANSGENPDLSPQEQAEKKQRDVERLDTMVKYCQSASCLRNHILQYFGQTQDEDCGHCGNCEGTFIQADISKQARAILSYIQQVAQFLGYHLGAALIVRVLRGSKDQRIKELELNNLPAYGSMKQLSRPKVHSYLDFLLHSGYVEYQSQHRVVSLTPLGLSAVNDTQKITMPLKVRPKADLTSPLPPKPQQDVSSETETLYEALKALRLQLAKAEGKPAYIVFSNANLMDMAQKAPRSMSAFMRVSGVGEVKAARYGDAFLRLINSFKA